MSRRPEERLALPTRRRPSTVAGPAAGPAAVVIHGHFYQPPRDDPWTDRTRTEPTAAPFDNWNERITAECYAPLAAAGAFAWLSFDLGPTLARWLERERPEVHEGFVRGDRDSRARLGHGNAIAQPYHHIILPLASRREKETEVRWGLRDFERRFGRCAEGLWLPETAVDTPTLEVLAAGGVAFTILAPHQVVEPPPGGLGRVRLGGGREISVFVYDGRLSHGVAFGELLEGGDAWFEALRAAADAGVGLVALATDGETFGHHHRGADRALLGIIARVRRSRRAKLENFASVLARAGETPVVRLREPSSWSCAHGVERWRADCGCKMAPHEESRQRWRGPLRTALDGLATGLREAYGSLAPGRLSEPGPAVVDLGAFLGTPDGLEAFARAAAAEGEGDKALALLQIVRDRAAMFTSCAWFFDDVAGIEPTQVLGYAAHALDRLATLAPERAAALEASFLEALAAAEANDPDVASAADIYTSEYGEGRRMTSPPLRFAFAIHLHQPVGNFDQVFEDHLAGVYRPLLDAIHERGTYPVTLHLSGPLLDWLERRAPGFLDDIGARVADGHIELLASGRYEPILASLAPRDRVEQVEWMRTDLRSRFGVEVSGLWLTERVWESDLAADLSHAGIGYTLLDDRHFLACGLEREELDRVFTTESGGSALRLLSIDERLRYLIPFRPVPEIVEFFRSRRRAGDRQLVLGDDGEKFGGWPDTRAWVYEGVWLDGFLRALDDLCERGEVELITTGDAAAGPSGGLVYPIAGSYGEMEAWTLPRPAALRLQRLATDRTKASGDPAGAASGPDETGHGPLVRGGHWKGFLRKYPEANRLHKTALRLSLLCRERGDPPEARRAIARAQCNDAYWHGVFGGVYLPHLRQAVWRELAAAERHLRAGEGIGYELLDFDFDGHDQIRVHSSRSSVVLSPARGGAIEILTVFREGVNHADVLSRRLEAYHRPAGEADPAAATAPRAVTGERAAATGGGIASVHERSAQAPIAPLPDDPPLALFQEFARDGTPDADAGEGSVLADWRLHPFVLAGPPAAVDAGVRIRLESALGAPRLAKTLDVHDDGCVEATLDWREAGLPPGAEMVCRLALAWGGLLEAEPAAARSTERIVTLARSERGFEWIDQGEVVELSWPAASGGARVRLTPGGGSERVGEIA